MTTLHYTSSDSETSLPQPAQQNVSNEKPETLPDADESMEARIERLGRERPAVFTSIWKEIAFCFSVVMSQILTEYFVSGFNILLPTLITDLDIPVSSSVWPATAFSLVIASTLLVWGRLGDQHGGYLVYLFGLAWLAVWSVIAGFSKNALMLDFCRALQGLGAAAFLPTGVMLIGSVYRPGPRKNLIFAVYGSAGVIGFFTGVFFAGLIAQFAAWGWYFWIGAVMTAITFATSFYAIENDREARKKHQIESDWLGAIPIVSGLVLFVFAITESAHAPNGWRTPYIPTLFSISIILLIIAVYIEGWVAKAPLVPADVFAVKGMAPLLISLFLLYGTVANYLLYGVQYWELYMGASPLQVVAWCVPLFIGGLILATSEGFLLHIIPGYYLLILSGIGALGAQLLLALIPEGGNYWAWLLPAMILATIGIDLSITLMMVFVTTAQPIARQGLAGGLVNSVLQLGMALFVGLADIIRVSTAPTSGDRGSYKNVFWFGVGVGGLALMLMTIWGRIPRQKSDLTADERLELEREASRVEA